MKYYRFLGENKTVVYVKSDDVLITDAQSALDLMATIYYEHDCTSIILDKEAFCEEFFRLSSGIAGEVAQKFINYQTKLAVIGDFSDYKSKPLNDFIRECNKGNHIVFVNDFEKAIEKIE